MAAVHPLIFLIGQRRDALRVAAGHKAIGRVREHGTLQRILQLSVRGGKGSLHLVVHHAAHSAVGIPVPALLLEHSPVHHGQRAEHRIQVDMALRKDAMLLLSSCRNGEVTGYFSLPASTECSRI